MVDLILFVSALRVPRAVTRLTVHRAPLHFVIPLMIFDALKVPGPSQSDPGSIWETSFFDKNFAQGKPEVNILVGAFSEPESIDLSVPKWNPH